MDRVRGLDSIRAVCAFWVVMSHFGGPPITAGIDQSTIVGRLVGGAYGHFWIGQAAVIVFFVISGFCIHYPFSRTLRIPCLAGYGARRYLRIGIPLAVAAVVAPSLGLQLSLFSDHILWSLAAELIYYAIYPALLVVRRCGISWRRIFAVSFIAAIFVAASNPTAKNYPSFGVTLNWLLGLPCWITGCALAERTSMGRLPNIGAIWPWRFAVWGASVMVSVLRVHTLVGSPWTLNLFAILAMFWLSREIIYYQTNTPPRWLERAGQWSYSVYLVHLPAHAVFAMLPPPCLGPMLNWIVKMGFILSVSYAFYRAVEFPAHVIARSVDRSLQRWNAGAIRSD